MSDQDLFNKDNDKIPPVETPPVESTQNQSPNYDLQLGMIVDAEGKAKYGSVDDALKGAAHAQAHIANLEQELAALRTDGEGSKKIEDVIAALQSQKDNDQKPADDGQPKGLSATDIQDLVKNAVRDINSQATQEQNIVSVTSKFKELYGEKASETLYSKANDLGMSKEDINGLIAKNPTAAFRVLGVDVKAKPNLDVTHSSVNSEQFQEKGEPKIESSMGYVTSKKLTSNWLASKAKTNERLSSQN